jgi:UDP-2,3-diacylglucosamine pyrophosphatase LpxH
MPKLSLIFSDTEFGGGNKTDDLVEGQLLFKTIKSHFKEAKKYPTEIVLNGDIFDFIKCPYKRKYPRHITEKISLYKLEKIINAHPKFFITLKEFLKNDKRSQIVFITGNHDFDIIFPKVQERIKQEICKKEEELKKRILFPGFEYKDKLIHYEHGSQLDPIFKVDPEKIIYGTPKDRKDPVLLVPWGYSAIYDFFIQMKEEFPLLERLVPKTQVLKTFPKKTRRKFMFFSTVYLFKSFFYTQFKYWGDKLYRFSPYELYYFVSTLFRKQFELLVIDQAKRKIKSGKYKVFVVGHSHGDRIHKTKHGKYVLNAGLWRDEYKYNVKDQTYHPKDKNYGYLLHDDKKIHKIEILKVKSQQKPIKLNVIKKIVDSYKKDISYFFK